MKSGALLQLTAATVSGILIGVAAVRAYDVRLDEALAALQKAAALADIQDAMDHIVAAGIAADASAGSQ
jgi:hypothetical protein